MEKPDLATLTQLDFDRIWDDLIGLGKLANQPCSSCACIRDENIELRTLLTDMTVLGLKVMGLTPGGDQTTLENLREGFADFSDLKAKFIEAAAMLGLGRDTGQEGAGS